MWHGGRSTTVRRQQQAFMKDATLYAVSLIVPVWEICRCDPKLLARATGAASRTNHQAAKVRWGNTECQQMKRSSPFWPAYWKKSLRVVSLFITQIVSKDSGQSVTTKRKSMYNIFCTRKCNSKFSNSQRILHCCAETGRFFSWKFVASHGWFKHDSSSRELIASRVSSSFEFLNVGSNSLLVRATNK